jgi:hypothetical protein
MPLGRDWCQNIGERCTILCKNMAPYLDMGDLEYSQENCPVMEMDFMGAVN